VHVARWPERSEVGGEPGERKPLSSRRQATERHFPPVSSSRPTGPFALAKLLFVCAACLAACNSAGTNTSRSSALLDSGAILYPAEQLLVTRCMSHNGFPFSPSLSAPASPSQLFPYGITSTSWAERHGFGRQFIQSGQPREPDPKAYAFALNGSGPSGPGTTVQLPTGQTIGHSTLGCVAYAEGVLYSGFTSWFRLDSLHSDLQILVQDWVKQSDRYRAAIVRWSRCMSRAGHSFSSPQAAMTHFLVASPAPKASVAVRAAVAESRCLASVDVPSIVKVLSRKFDRLIARRYARVIQDYEHKRRSAISRAHKILEVLCRARMDHDVQRICSHFLGAASI
jgi:hypothetical protein